MVGLSFFIEELLVSLETLEKQILINGDENEAKGYAGLKYMLLQYLNHHEKTKLRENVEGKNCPKLEKLIEIIKEKEKMEENQMTILIFVNKRMIAKYMSNIMKLYFEKRVGFIVGQSNTKDGKIKEGSQLLLEKKVSELPKHSEINDIFERNIAQLNENLLNKNTSKGKLKTFFQEKYSLQQQLSVIQQFKSKKIDFLISTSVTEEGFDVPNCNLVIAYNDVKTIRSFIQLKGRARKENSEFLLFTPMILVKTNLFNIYIFIL